VLEEALEIEIIVFAVRDLRLGSLMAKFYVVGQ
jgi:hypothetical protein